MSDAFGQFYFDCEGEQSIEQLRLSIKPILNGWTVWALFAAAFQ
jgi:hypothetical protein